MRVLTKRVSPATAALLLFLLMSGPVAAGEVLVNGGFESGALSPWFQDRTFGTIIENWTVTTTLPHSGTFAATDNGNAELRQNFAGVATDSITQISFWAMHPDATINALFVDLFYSDGTDTGFLVNTVGTTYNYFDVTSDLVAGETLIGFSIFGNSGGQTFFDDASIITSAAVPEPASVVLLALGLASACGFLRRARRRGLKGYGPGFGG